LGTIGAQYAIAGEFRVDSAPGADVDQDEQFRKDLLPGKSAARLAEYGTAVPDQLLIWDEP
jgi:hypothetical protein